MTLSPLPGRVRIKPDTLNRVSAGGIIFAPQAIAREERDRKIARTGVVLQMGPNAHDRKGREIVAHFKPGDRVVYQYGQLSSDGIDAWCAVNEILAVIE